MLVHWMIAVAPSDPDLALVMSSTSDSPGTNLQPAASGKPRRRPKINCGVAAPDAHRRIILEMARWPHDVMTSQLKSGGPVLRGRLHAAGQFCAIVALAVDAGRDRRAEPPSAKPNPWQAAPAHRMVQVLLSRAMQGVTEALKRLQEILLRGPDCGGGLEEAVIRLRSDLPPSVLQHFDGLTKRGKRGIVPAVNGVCSGCHLQLATATKSMLGKAHELGRCDHCGRFLYAQGPTAERIAEQTTYFLIPREKPVTRRRSKADRTKHG